MQTLVYWQRQPLWRYWLPAVLSAMPIFAAWYFTEHGHPWGGYLAVPAAGWTFVPDWCATRLITFAGGYLVVVKGWTRLVPIALAGAHVERSGKHWRIRWSENERQSTYRIPADPPTDALLNAVRSKLDEAAATGAALPAEPAGFPGVVQTGWESIPSLVFWSILIAAGSLAALALYTQMPAFALPISLGPYFIRYELRRRRYVLARDGLWIAEPGVEPIHIPLDAITLVTGDDQVLTVCTRDRRAPAVTMKVNGLGTMAAEWIERTA